MAQSAVMYKKSKVHDHAAAPGLVLSGGNVSAKLDGSASNRRLTAHSEGLNRVFRENAAMQLVANQSISCGATVMQLMSPAELENLRAMIAQALNEAGLSAEADDVQRVINVVAPRGGADRDFEDAERDARQKIARMAALRRRPDPPQPQAQQQGQPDLNDEQRRAARAARFGNGAEQALAEQRQRDAEGHAVGQAAANARIFGVGDRWNAHLTDNGGDGEAGIDWNRAVAMIRSTVPEAIGPDRFGVPSYSIRYGRGLTIVYSSPDGGQTLNVFHIGPGG